MPDNAKEDSTDTQAAETTEATDGDKLTLTAEELDAKIAEAVAAAVKADRKKAKAKAKTKAHPQDDAEDAEDEDDTEDADEIVRKAETRAALAEQRAAEAEKKATLAVVENKLRDYLALNFRDLIGNAPDIMLHVEKALTPGAKDAEIARLIDSHSKAFAERTKAARRPTMGATVGGARGRIAGVTSGTTDNPTDRQAAAAAANVQAASASPRPWSTLNYH